MHESLNRMRWLALSAMFALAGCVQTGAGLQAADPARLAEAQAQRLAELFSQAMPLGEIVRVVASRNPLWPVQDVAPGKVSPAQLACMRAELVPARVTKFQQDDARKFAQRHPERVADAIRLLEDGAAQLMGRLVMAGGQAELSGHKPDAAALLRDATPGQMNNFIQLAQHPEQADLRRALGLEGVAGGDTATAHARGRQAGQMMMLKPMLAAMEACKLPMSTIF